MRSLTQPGYDHIAHDRGPQVVAFLSLEDPEEAAGDADAGGEPVRCFAIALGIGVIDGELAWSRALATFSDHGWLCGELVETFTTAEEVEYELQLCVDEEDGFFPYRARGRLGEGRFKPRGPPTRFSNQGCAHALRPLVASLDEDGNAENARRLPLLDPSELAAVDDALQAQVLSQFHAMAPGLNPRPEAHFTTEWEPEAGQRRFYPRDPALTGLLSTILDGKGVSFRREQRLSQFEWVEDGVPHGMFSAADVLIVDEYYYAQARQSNQ